MNQTPLSGWEHDQEDLREATGFTEITKSTPNSPDYEYTDEQPLLDPGEPKRAFWIDLAFVILVVLVIFGVLLL